MRNIFILSCHHFNVTRGVETYNENLAKLLTNFKTIDKVCILGLAGKISYSTEEYESIVVPFPKKLYKFLAKLGETPLIGRLLSKIPFFHPWNILNYFFYKRLVKKISHHKDDTSIVILSGPGWSASKFSNFKTIYVGHSGGGIADIIGSSSIPNYYISINGLDESKVSGKNYLKIYNTVSFPLLNEAITYYSSRKFIKRSIDILFVGALIDEKAPQKLLDALIFLDIPLTAVFLGKGSLKKNLLQKALKTKVNLTITNVPHSEISSYYKSARIFILPSKHEPFGLVYREAAIFGCMVLAPDDKVRRVVVPNAYFFSENKLVDILKHCFFIKNVDMKRWKNDLILEKERQKSFIFNWEKITNE